MDKHFLLLLLSLSLLLGVLQALVCYKCDSISADGSCATNQSTCEAQSREACVLHMVYEEGNFVSGYQRCQYLCNPDGWILGSKRLFTKCCVKNFCNSL